MCPLLERGIFTTCELLGRGKHRGKGKMPDYSGNLPCIRQVSQLVLHLGLYLIIRVALIVLRCHRLVVYKVEDLSNSKFWSWTRYVGFIVYLYCIPATDECRFD